MSKQRTLAQFTWLTGQAHSCITCHGQRGISLHCLFVSAGGCAHHCVSSVPCLCILCQTHPQQHSVAALRCACSRISGFTSGTPTQLHATSSQQHFCSAASSRVSTAPNNDIYSAPVSYTLCMSVRSSSSTAAVCVHWSRLLLVTSVLGFGHAMCRQT